ncbi:hypothetical protein K3G63_02175 [Hymenobacter sp. HSC-4F20]|uniref:hypothetical protein n=1 Tax=Hymenobacter sp. HSC-4F20 TaxID=2864135 RepID=UPI001C7371E1|nr:hypothetical protein [Hymenobacter sp. HSC-4F20]MBX0289223.1 hypothetical protein [Hymenobacter sp. HSC-4F20]
MPPAVATTRSFVFWVSTSSGAGNLLRFGLAEGLVGLQRGSAYLLTRLTPASLSPTSLSR